MLPSEALPLQNIYRHISTKTVILEQKYIIYKAWIQPCHTVLSAHNCTSFLCTWSIPHRKHMVHFEA